MIFSARARPEAGLSGVVDAADLLGAVPGYGDFLVPFVRLEGSGEASALPVGQVLDAGAQQVADAVERVAPAAPVAVDLLLNPAPDLVQRLGSEGDYVKGVQDRDRVAELVVDRVLVPVERVQGGDLDGGAEGLAALGEPVGVDAAGAARNQVQQPRVDSPGLVRGQVDHPGADAP